MLQTSGELNDIVFKRKYALLAFWVGERFEVVS
jgi:hypothetical protein